MDRINFDQLIYICFFASVLSAQKANYYNGIAIPGRTVATSRIFELYLASCSFATKRSGFMQQIKSVFGDFTTEAVSDKIYNSLYSTMGDVDLEKLMGIWYMVISTPSLHLETCVTSVYKLIDKSQYTGTFSVQSYLRKGDNVSIVEGYGRKIGPDPGEVLISTGNAADLCPYSIIRTGPVNEENLYDYLILSQPLKMPTIVLAREAIFFEKNYKSEVKEFLTKHGFWSPVVSLNTALAFVNSTLCDGEKLLLNS